MIVFDAFNQCPFQCQLPTNENTTIFWNMFATRFANRKKNNTKISGPPNRYVLSVSKAMINIDFSYQCKRIIKWMIDRCSY